MNSEWENLLLWLPWWYVEGGSRGSHLFREHVHPHLDPPLIGKTSHVFREHVHPHLDPPLMMLKTIPFIPLSCESMWTSTAQARLELSAAERGSVYSTSAFGLRHVYFIEVDQWFPVDLDGGRPQPPSEPQCVSDLTYLFDPRLIGVEEGPGFYMLGDKLAAHFRNVLPVPQHRQGQVLLGRLLQTCSSTSSPTTLSSSTSSPTTLSSSSDHHHHQHHPLHDHSIRHHILFITASNLWFIADTYLPGSQQAMLDIKWGTKLLNKQAAATAQPLVKPTSLQQSQQLLIPDWLKLVLKWCLLP